MPKAVKRDIAHPFALDVYGRIGRLAKAAAPIYDSFFGAGEAGTPMFNLSSILQSAQGGQAIDNLAGDFGLSADEAKQGVDALLPALSAALKSKMSDPGALGSLLGSLNDPQLQAAFQNSQAAQSDEAQMAGSQALDNVMGPQAITAVAQRAADATGLSPELLEQMLPRVAAIALGGVMTAAKDNGLDGVLGQIGQAAQTGGLGRLLGQSEPDAGAPASGFGGVIGGLFGSFMGGRSAASADSAPNVDPAVAQTGLASLAGLFEHGAEAPAELEQDFGRLFGDK